MTGVFWTERFHGAALALLLLPISGLAEDEVAALFDITREAAFAPLPSEASPLSAAIYAAIEQAGDDQEFIIAANNERYRDAYEKGECEGMVVAAALINRARKKLGQTEAFDAGFATATCSEFCAPYFYFPSLIEFSAGRYKQSLALLKRALPLCSTKKERVNVLMTIGACASGLGEVAESVRFAQWAYEQSPKPVSWKLVVNISSNLMGLGRPDEATAILREYLASGEDPHPVILLNKMQGHAMCGQADSVWTAWSRTETLLPPLPWSPMILRSLSSTAVLMPTEAFWNEVRERAWASAAELDLAQMFDEDDVRGLLFPQVPNTLAELIAADSMRWRVASELRRQMDILQRDSGNSVRRALSTEEAQMLLSRVNGSEDTTDLPFWLMALGLLGAFPLISKLREQGPKQADPAKEAKANEHEAPSNGQPSQLAFLQRIEQSIRANVLPQSSHDDLIENLKSKSDLLRETILPRTNLHQIDGTELDVLVLTLLGFSSKTIAQICDVSVGHIYNARTQLRTKLGNDALTLSHWL